MNPHEALQAIGLNEKETAVYLAALELGQDTVSNIAKKARIKRPTCYLVLETLKQRGLIHAITKGTRTFFSAEDPTKLLGLIAEKHRALKTVLPYLHAINNRQPHKPRVKFYEGAEGVLTIYQEAFESDKIRFWGSIEDLMRIFPEPLDWFMEISKKKKPRVFDLLNDSPEARAYAKKVLRPGYEIRFFPKDLRVSIDSVLFKNKVGIVAFTPEPHGLLIESNDIVQSFSSLWELAWRGAKPYTPTPSTASSAIPQHSQ